MIKTIAIVSLSSGILGEDFVRHERLLGLQRLERRGLRVKYMPNALKGLDFLQAHPEARADDLLAAFRDPEVDMILCAIGGDDTYRMLPFLFDHDELQAAVQDKVFLGFSDTTINHLMLHKVGLRTFYGQSFLADVCELGGDMLPYTAQYLDELIATGSIRQVTPSPLWYEERASFGPDQVGVPLAAHPNAGFQLLQGPGRFSGEILGGCIDSLYDLFDGERYPDMPALCARYGLLPPAEAWQGKILLLETSEEKMPPEKFRRALEYLKGAGIFRAVSGVLVGKPMDGAHQSEYHQLLRAVIDDPALPILANVSIGHAQPRCILPFGVEATVDAARQTITFAPWSTVYK